MIDAMYRQLSLNPTELRRWSSMKTVAAGCNSLESLMIEMEFENHGSNKHNSNGNNTSKGKLCAAICCRNRASPGLKISFFRFPRDPDRCRLWVDNIGVKRLQQLSSTHLNKSYRICAEHFEPKMFTNPDRKNLTWNAIPTVFSTQNPIPDLLLKSETSDLKTSYCSPACAEKGQKESVGHGNGTIQVSKAKQFCRGRSCSAIGCSNRAMIRKDIKFFTFPRNEERRKQWIANVGKKSLESVEPAKLSKNYSLCAEHFEDRMFTHPDKNRLNWNAVPTIFKQQALEKPKRNESLKRNRQKDSKTSIARKVAEERLSRVKASKSRKPADSSTPNTGVSSLEHSAVVSMLMLHGSTADPSTSSTHFDLHAEASVRKRTHQSIDKGHNDTKISRGAVSVSPRVGEKAPAGNSCSVSYSPGTDQSNANNQAEQQKDAQQSVGNKDNGIENILESALNQPIKTSYTLIQALNVTTSTRSMVMQVLNQSLQTRELIIKILTLPSDVRAVLMKVWRQSPEVKEHLLQELNQQMKDRVRDMIEKPTPKELFKGTVESHSSVEVKPMQSELFSDESRDADVAELKTAGIPVQHFSSLRTEGSLCTDKIIRRIDVASREKAKLASAAMKVDRERVKLEKLRRSQELRAKRLGIRSAGDSKPSEYSQNRIQNQIRLLRKRYYKETKEKKGWMKKVAEQDRWLQHMFNADQLAFMKRNSPKGMVWKPSTLQKAVDLWETCGVAGYELLVKQKLPLPSVRTVQRCLKAARESSSPQLEVSVINDQLSEGYDAIRNIQISDEVSTEVLEVVQDCALEVGDNVTLSCGTAFSNTQQLRTPDVTCIVQTNSVEDASRTDTNSLRYMYDPTGNTIYLLNMSSEDVENVTIHIEEPCGEVKTVNSLA